MNIDAHQHYWDPSRGDYGWLTPALGPLYRAFGPEDLAPLRSAVGITRTVVVQAAPTLDETHYLLDLARVDDSIAAVVGWVPLDAPNAPALIAAFAQVPAFKGIRPMLQDLPDDRWIMRPSLEPAINAMIDADLSLDALVFTRHLPALAEFALRYPNLRIVIDHGAKPPIREAPNGWQPWADAMALLAALPQQLHCKLSGLATEAGPDWSIDTLRPYVYHLLKHFGSSRLLWGSDWPVLNTNGDYHRWHAVARRLLFEHDVDSDACAAVFGNNAKRFYRL